MSNFQKMLEKKAKKGKISDIEKEAKMNVIGGMRDMASDMMKGNLKKVTVAASNNSDLKEGLKKAQELVDKTNGETRADDIHHAVEDGEMEAHSPTDWEQEEDSEPGHDLSEESEYENPNADKPYHEDMSEEDVDSKLKELMKRKDQMKSKKK